MLNFKTKAGFRQSKKDEKKRLNNNEKGMSSSDIFSKVSATVGYDGPLGGDAAPKFDEKPTSDTLAPTRKFKGAFYILIHLNKKVGRVKQYPPALNRII